MIKGNANQRQTFKKALMDLRTIRECFFDICTVLSQVVKVAYFTDTFKGACNDSRYSVERSFHSLNERTSFLLHAEPK